MGRKIERTRGRWGERRENDRKQKTYKRASPGCLVRFKQDQTLAYSLEETFAHCPWGPPFIQPPAQLLQLYGIEGVNDFGRLDGRAACPAQPEIVCGTVKRSHREAERLILQDGPIVGEQDLKQLLLDTLHPR